MKKILSILILSAIALVFTACGASYQGRQTPEQMKEPFNCNNLHLKNARWTFTDDYGQTVYATGRCAAGMKHGGFMFYVNEKLVAKTKFVRDAEQKTTCLAGGKKSSTDLNSCMATAAQLAAGASTAAPAEAAPVEASPLDAEEATDTDFLDAE